MGKNYHHWLLRSQITDHQWGAQFWGLLNSLLILQGEIARVTRNVIFHVQLDRRLHPILIDMV